VSIAEKKRDFASSGFTIRPKGGILYPYHSKIQEETMDIRQLHYFLVLCEEMNYTRAAQRLFLSRQALRQSISALEAELCGPLFLSAHHKLSLTDRGVSLQRHAAPVVEQFQQMQAALHAEIQSAPAGAHRHQRLAGAGLSARP
jgi:DNA-binding transcriptional LysR family regulator